jgi:hypothetical protein
MYQHASNMFARASFLLLTFAVLFFLALVVIQVIVIIQSSLALLLHALALPDSFALL